MSQCDQQGVRSIDKQLGPFTRESVIQEANRWLEVGRSCFVDEVQQRGLSSPQRSEPPAKDGKRSPSLLDRLVRFTDTPAEAVPSLQTSADLGSMLRTLWTATFSYP